MSAVSQSSTHAFIDAIIETYPDAQQPHLRDNINDCIQAITLLAQQFHLDNVQRTRLHAHLQLLLIRFRTLEHVDRYIMEVKALKKAKQHQFLQEYMKHHEDIQSVLDGVKKINEKYLAIERIEGTSTTIRIARAALTLILATMGAISMILLLPLGLLHFPMRWLGINSVYFPLNALQRGLGQIMLCGLGITPIVENEVDNDNNGKIVLYTHTSIVDGILISSILPWSVKLISNKSLFSVSVIGWALSICSNIPLNRANRSKAIEELKQTAAGLKNYRCVGISPEGTRSRSGQLQDFKKGAFHVALQSGVAVTPVIIKGAAESLSSHGLPSSGQNVCRILPSVEAEGTANELRDRVQRAMLLDLRDQYNVVKSRRVVRLREMYTVALPVLVCFVSIVLSFIL